MFEFRAATGLRPDPVVSRAAPHRRGVETIVLVSGLRNKHVQQAAIDAAARSRAAYLSRPFELRDE